MRLAVEAGREAAVREVLLRKPVGGAVTGLPRRVEAHGADAGQHLFTHP